MNEESGFSSHGPSKNYKHQEGKVSPTFSRPTFSLDARNVKIKIQNSKNTALINTRIRTHRYKIVC